MATPVVDIEYRYLVPADANDGTLFSSVAVFDGSQWAALCRELDIASVGESADEALASLVQAVTEALEYAAERGRLPGSPVPDEALLEFMQSHRGQGPAITTAFLA